MLIYEKNNKLNINFDPSKSIEGTPDIQIGENEIKLRDTEITSENVLPTPTNEDVGKIVSVGEGGSYELVPFQEPTGTIEITENGIVDVADYASANVQVPNPSSGSISITQNGTYDVTEKASAVVNVASNVKLGSVEITNNSGHRIVIGNSVEVSDGKLINKTVSINNGTSGTVDITSKNSSNVVFFLMQIGITGAAGADYQVNANDGTTITIVGSRIVGENGLIYFTISKSAITDDSKYPKIAISPK